VEKKTLNQKKNTISLPLAAIQNKGEQLYVITENKQTQEFEEKEVKLGPSHDHQVEIQSGLQDGDVVMVKKFAPSEEN
jgi:multidrug efflux pump subunit AcrA (membrane-fusion protein)